MSDVKQELKDYRLALLEREDPERQLVDFEIADEDDNVAWCWGDSYTDVDFECSHPDVCVEYEDDESQCECMLCGSWGDWHKEDDGEGHFSRVPHEWYPRRMPGGLIGQYLEELRAADE